MRRRTLLRRGAVLAAVGLAGCAESPADDPTPEPTDSPTETPSPMPTPTASPSPEPTATASETASPTEGSTATRSPSATQTPTPTATPTATAAPTPTATPTPDQEVVVGPGGSLSFDPKSFQIAVGDTVVWTWDAGGHNVKASSTPSGSDWTGTPGGEFDTFGTGHTYTYTFDVAGTYEYYCAPHRSAGMTGSFTVG